MGKGLSRTKVLVTSAFGVFIVIALVLIVYLFAERTEQGQREIGLERVSEVTRTSTGLVMEYAHSKLSQMRSVAAVMADFDDLHGDEPMRVLREMTRNYNFFRMAFDFSDGTSLTTDGHTLDITNSGYLDRLLGTEAFITPVTPSDLDAMPSVSFVCPVIKNGESIGAVRGSVFTQDISRVLNVSLYGGQGYYELIDIKGDYLAFSDNLNMPTVHSNFFDDLNALEFTDNYSANEIIKDMGERQSDYAIYKYNGGTRLSYYTPAGVEGWYLFVTIPTRVIDATTQTIYESGLQLVLQIVGVLVAVFVLITYLLLSERKNIANYNAQLLLSEKRYRFILERSNSVIFEYNLLDGSIIYSEKHYALFGRNPGNIWNPEDSSIHPHDIHLITDGINQILSGKPSLSGEVRIINSKGDYIWCLITALTIYSSDERPVKVMGIIEDVSERKRSEILYREAQMYKNALYADGAKLYEINLSKNIFINGLEDARMLLPDLTENNYEMAQTIMARQYVIPEERETLLRATSVANLLKEFSSGQSETAFDVRMMSKDNALSYMRYKFHMFSEPDSQNICAILSVTDITEQKRREQELIERATRDSLTHLYNKVTTDNLVREFITSERGRAQHHALLFIDIDNFKLVNDRLGHYYGDMLLTKLTERLRGLFRGGDIIGRVGGDEMIVFMKNLRSVDVAISKAREICEAFTQTVTSGEESVTISASVGIALYPESGTDFETLYRNADSALYIAKSRGKSTFYIYDGTYARYESSRTEIDTGGAIVQKSFRENSMEYIFKMLYTSEETEKSIAAALGLIADYFEFDKGLIFEPSSGMVIHEWSKTDKPPTKDNVSLDMFGVSAYDLRKEGNCTKSNGTGGVFAFAVNRGQRRMQNCIVFELADRPLRLSEAKHDELMTMCAVLAMFVAHSNA